MKSFNLNNKVLVQITGYGWSELLKNHGQEYIDTCILTRKKVIDNIDYYEMQAHEIISNWDNSVWMANPCPININILIPN